MRKTSVAFILIQKYTDFKKSEVGLKITEKSNN